MVNPKRASVCCFSVHMRSIKTVNISVHPGDFFDVTKKSPGCAEMFTVFSLLICTLKQHTLDLSGSPFKIRVNLIDFKIILMMFTSMHCLFIFMDTEQVTRWLFARECAIIEPQTLQIFGIFLENLGNLEEFWEILNEISGKSWEISGNSGKF